jgi:hypothetical protein
MILERTIATQKPRTGDEDVEPTRACKDVDHCGCDLIGLRDIRRQRDNPILFERSDIQDPDPRPRLPETLGNGSTDTS